ncbi:MAG TPA: pyridoxal phosphate-dependent aminotransferase [Candidatus Saccharimonadales bacterium]|nr:pyridoxal phosphate-dependent aminotransferase [Candidatus Saccharimonadales bacterium]
MQKQPTLSQRGINTPTSVIRELNPLAEAAKEKGIRVYHVNIGDPDFPIPDEIKKSLHSFANQQAKLPYPAFRGQKSLLAAWRKYYKDITIPVDFVDEDMIITAGASNALINVMAATADPGEEILVLEPFYAPYLTHAGFVSVKLISVALDAAKNYHLPSKEEIVAKITPKTKAILFTHPNNPTGTVFRRDEMELLIEIAKEYGLYIISDETYRGLVFEDRECLSMFEVAQKEDLNTIIVVDSLSKRLNVCGARVGAIVSKNQEFMAAAFRFTQGLPFAAYIEQEIVHTQLANCVSYIQFLKGEYQKRRDVFINALNTYLHADIPKPEGAFYAMIQLPIDNSVTFAKWLLTDFQENNETVMVSPGSGFYTTPGKGANEIRVAYILQEKDLERAAELLAHAIKRYNEVNK